jgi:L-histidine N-alpha-methyltransferase
VTAAAAVFDVPQLAATHPVADAARRGLTSTPKSLPPWLFYDAPGSRLFEQITTLPEYYLTRTERDLFTAHAAEIFHLVTSSTSGCPMSDGLSSDMGIHHLTIVELGAGTASKTGILLRALTCLQPSVLYQPVDISPTALDEACESIESNIPGVAVRPQVANYITETVRIERPPQTPGSPASSLAGVVTRILALYIGSSIGNFSPAEARQILTRLRSELEVGDALLLGADLAPNPAATPAANGHGKSVATLLAAYNDTQGVTAAFNRNILARLNRDLGANFRPRQFIHRALWNPTHSRIEIYLESLSAQTVTIPANSAGGRLSLHFAQGETIHTENSYKFTPAAIAALLTDSAFTPTRTFTDANNLFAVTLAAAI